MIDHFNLPVSDLARSRRFYERVLAPLGFQFLMQDGDAVGFGTDTWRFGIVATLTPFPSLHLAFTAGSRVAVDGFFEAATSLGAQANGPPGIRPHYDPDYYAAFVLDPDGHNIEAVCRKRSAG
ncbi:MAG: VOC family protein [Deltaproteobacteria bacterium]|nr:VOC family protein [Deltaproteobacteria bacterium]MBI3386236.1 VOC family protein [Deltaproteobacteria bacterium]